MNTSYDAIGSNGNDKNSESMSGKSSSRDVHREGKLTRSIEHQTAKLPSDIFLWAAGAALMGSLALQIAGLKQGGVRQGLFGRQTSRAPLAGFVGQWVPTLLLFGIYNKIVKVAGSDRASR